MTFFNYANQAGWLDPGDLDEALALSWKAGDPDVVAWFEPGAHGSSEQRVAAFRRGFSAASRVAVLRASQAERSYFKY